MAAAGGVINQSVLVKQKPELLIQNFVSATAGTSGYTINTAGANSLVLVRKYTPTWAVVVGVLGILLFLIGLLAFLIKETESVTVTLAEGRDGTRVTISGVATPEMQARLNSVISGSADRSGFALGDADRQGGEQVFFGSALADAEHQAADGNFAGSFSMVSDVVEHAFESGDLATLNEAAAAAEAIGSAAQDDTQELFFSLASETRSQLATLEAEASAAAANEAEPEDEKTCPDCAEAVKAAARICRFCGYEFSSSETPRAPTT
jgi:hypothetical protein